MLNSKFLNISLKTWIMIIVTILYLIFKKNPEKFTESENDSDNIIETSENPEIPVRTKAYNFNTTWCSFSRQFQPTWDKFDKVNNDSDVDIIDVKCDDESNKDSKKLCQQYPVRGYPTVLFVRGENIAEYSGDRSATDLEKTLQNFKN